MRTEENKCQFCNYSTSNIYHFKEHVDAVHLKIRNLKCQQCEYTTSSQRALRHHMTRQHDKIRLQCKDCEYSTSNHRFLKKHMINVHKGKTKKESTKSLKCALCNFTARLTRKLTMHMDEAHAEQKKEELVCQPNPFPLKCDESDLVTGICYNYKCDNCSYKASSEHELKLHIKAVHVKRENSIDFGHKLQDKINDSNCKHCLNMKLKNLELEHQNAALKLKNLEVEQKNAALMRELSASKENFVAEKRLREDLEETLFISSCD